jgi:hypothetical protein
LEGEAESDEDALGDVLSPPVPVVREERGMPWGERGSGFC